MTASVQSRFYSLDFIRGLAAISVVFWHWQHFFYNGSTPGTFNVQDQPFYQFFFLLYHKGWLAVDFFFSLSGFIFFWLYAEKIKERRVSAFHFFALRFSRLYPLHAATFVFVLISQLLFFNSKGDYFVYPNNDIYHAILHIFMASNWGMEKGWSFNAPIWSVSIEILMYAIFFFACFFFRMRFSIVLILIFTGLLMLEARPVIGRGIFSFFIGGLTYLCYQTICHKNLSSKFLIGSLILAILLWLAAITEVKLEWFWPRINESLKSQFKPEWHIYISEISQRAAIFFTTGLIFPITIISAVLIEDQYGFFGKQLRFIGDISYSSYLLHFPIQLLLFLLVIEFELGQDFFYSGLSMIVYFGILIPICLISYYLFECPMQKFFRTILIVK